MILLDSNQFNGYDFIKEIVTSPVIDGSFNLALQRIQELAIGLAVIFYLFTLAYNYAKSNIASLQGEGGKYFDLSELVRTIVIIILILNYGIIANGISSFVDIINSGTAISQNEINQYAEKLATLNKNRADSPEKLKNEALNNIDPDDPKTAEKSSVLKSDDGTQQDPDKVGEEETNDMSWYEYLKPQYWAMMTIDTITVFLVGIIKVIISMFTLLVFKTLLIFGSLAFAFSIIPAFRGQIDNWFGTVLTTGFVFTTMNILDFLLYNIIQSHTFNPAGIDYSSSLIFDGVIIIIYLSSFWLTSKYIGKGDAGRVLSKGVTMATGAVMLAAAATGGGAAAGGGGGAAGGGASKGPGSLGNVASGAKDAFKDDSE